MISITTMGKFWPQAGHGVLSDGGKYGVDEMESIINFKTIKMPTIKANKVLEADIENKKELIVVKLLT